MRALLLQLALRGLPREAHAWVAQLCADMQAAWVRVVPHGTPCRSLETLVGVWPPDGMPRFTDEQAFTRRVIDKVCACIRARVYIFLAVNVPDVCCWVLHHAAAACRVHRRCLQQRLALAQAAQARA